MTRLLAPLLLLLLVAAAVPAEETVLISVNGEAVTAADIDALIMAQHRRGAMQSGTNRDLDRLLEKSVNDRLLAQQALAMGLDEDPELRIEVADKLAAYAVNEMVDADYVEPPAPEEAAVRAEFEAYYWTLELRQVSLRTREEAEAARAAVLAGADMDSLARAGSLDVYKHRGGLHNIKPWADVELPLREALGDPSWGDVTEVFPYRESFAFLRVEQRFDVDEAAWPLQKNRLQRHLHTVAGEVAWAAYLEDLYARFPVTINEAALEVVRADSSRVFESVFVNESDMPLLLCGPDERFSESAFRRAVSRKTMENGMDPFALNLQRTLDEEVEKIALRTAAAAAGYNDSPSVLRRVRSDSDALLIQAYLQETIVPEIVFKREEFVEFHRENADEFRGEPRVKLDVFIAPDEATGRRAEERLAEGADFDYVRREILGGDAGASKTEWAPLSIFSAAIRDEVARVGKGGVSKAIPIPTGWMLFRVVDEDAGAVRPLEEVEMQVRQYMFQKKFNALLDEHLALLKERSEIVRHDDRIRAYFESD